MVALKVEVSKDVILGKAIEIKKFNTTGKDNNDENKVEYTD
jgi:hypothetical protein